MASVSSLDQDMRKLRLERYTPGAAKEVRNWIEETLNERLQGADLMEALKDGVALCKLVNLIASPGVRYKSSSMPFVQMENISHFLRACEMAPLNLPSHDRFLTVDLYDQKDPAQVLQCIAAFSRRANAINSSAFPTTIGAKSKGGAMSPQGTGGSHTKSPSYTINTPPPKIEPVTAFNPLNKAAYSGRISPPKQSSLSRGGLATGGPVSSWSKQSDQNSTAPAWNIHQYGYMGGASQGNQGVAFGARRQITTAGPEVPSLAEKEKRLKQREDDERLRQEEELQRQQREAEQEEARARAEEERRWAEETRRAREEEERLKLEEESRLRDEEENRHQQQQAAVEARMSAQRNQERQVSDSRLNGQFLSQYQSSQRVAPQAASDNTQAVSDESRRIAELERQLAEMKEAEKRRQQQQQVQQSRDVPQSTQPHTDSKVSHEDDWDASEREYLQKQHQVYKEIEAEERTPPRAQPLGSAPTTRPLPDPSSYTPGKNRVDRYLATNPPPPHTTPSSHRTDDFGTATEVDVENQRRAASQQKTKAGAWASKSLLEREMERERERQREWEENQKATSQRTRNPDEGSGAGQTWDVHQYGYMGGDSQNRGGLGLGTSGARRQIIGPRPPP